MPPHRRNEPPVQGNPPAGNNPPANNPLANNPTIALIAGDELNSLNEAKSSQDWPEWRKAIDEELKLLNEMGTWELVEKLLDAITIPNKWTCVKKRNKSNQVVRHKARLVVKGCAQCPGHEFTETYSPVVRAETLQAPSTSSSSTC
jgi:hypothetical protein